MATKRKRTKEQNADRRGAGEAPRSEYRSASRTAASAEPQRRSSGDSPARTAARGSSTSSSGRKRPSAQTRKRRWPLVLVSVVLALVIAVVAAFSWDRWLRYDDAADLQGEWQPQGSTAVFVIDGSAIKLTPDVAYSYTIDSGAKTIAYTFGSMTGQGRYRFSLDRTQLVITDGEHYTGLSTLIDDIGWMVDQLARTVQGQPQEETVDESSTVLNRLSYNATAEPKEGSVSASAPEATAEKDDGEAQKEEADAQKEDSDSAKKTGGLSVSDRAA